jgi:hypothetical protein
MNPYTTLNPGERGLVVRKFKRVGEGDQWQQIMAKSRGPLSGKGR